jgi:hypothetical protein
MLKVSILLKTAVYLPYRLVTWGGGDDNRYWCAVTWRGDPARRSISMFGAAMPASQR